MFKSPLVRACKTSMALSTPPKTLAENTAVKRMISMAINLAKSSNTKIGICGQAPSDYPDFAEFLVREGIDSISLMPDTVLKTIKNIKRIEDSQI